MAHFSGSKVTRGLEDREAGTHRFLCKYTDAQQMHNTSKLMTRAYARFIAWRGDGAARRRELTPADWTVLCADTVLLSIRESHANLLVRRDVRSGSEMQRN